MNEMALYTIREIAHQLGLPESTVRYYRDAFAEQIPTVGSGRRRRYLPEAVAILRLIAQGYAAGKSHENISAELQAGAGPHLEHQAPVLATRQPARPGGVEHDELLATILDGERERREAMWQVAREIVRLGEAIERQQAVLGEIAAQLADYDSRTPAGGDTESPTEPPPEGAPVSSPQPPISAPELDREVASLQEQLTQERELVDRLRKSKLVVERRATEAERQLSKRGSSGRRRSVLGRLMSREPPEGERGE